MELALSEDSQSLEQLKLLKEITIITSDQHTVLSPPMSLSPFAQLISRQAVERKFSESGFIVNTS